MPTLNTSLNSLLATNYSEFTRQVAPLSAPPGNQLARELRPMSEQFAPGTKISARFDYVVGEKGQLRPTATTIRADSQEDAASGQPPQQRSYDRPDGRPQSFHDLLRPKAALQPADEMALFAAQNGATDGSPQTVGVTAQDETGAAVEVEVVTGETPRAQAGAAMLASRRQQEISLIYARNNDIVYNVTPALQLAA